MTLTSFLHRWLFLLLLLPAGWLCAPSVAHAQQNGQDVTCQATISPINFGTVSNPQNGAATNGSITAQCTNYTTQQQQLTLCYNIGNGPQGLNGSNQRQMPGPGGSNLAFQLWRNAAQSQIAGSIHSATNNTPISVQFPVPAATSRRGVITPAVTNVPIQTIYASIPAGQVNISAGSYTTTFSGTTNVQLTGNIGYVNCSTTVDDGVSTLASFTVSAIVTPTCTVSATDVSLGSKPATATNIQGTGTITVTCVNGTSYNVGLSPTTTNGGTNNGTGNMVSSAPGNTDKVPYALYQNSGYSTPWGNIIGTNTLGPKTGTGNTQNWTVYAQAPGANYKPGAYQDTITIAVTY